MSDTRVSAIAEYIRKKLVPVSFLAYVLVFVATVTPVIKARTPKWMWIIDHCPSSEYACGSPAAGALLVALLALLPLTTAILLWRYYGVEGEAESDSDS